MIRFNAKTQIIISDNCVEDTIKLLQEEGFKYSAVVVDMAVSNNSDILSLVAALKNKCLFYPVKAQEPTTDMVNEHVAHLRGKGIDFLIGIGGGSILDLTKALSVMLVNSGKVEEYHGTGKSFICGIKKMLIPTTAGTGSEVTPGAVLVNKVTKFKRSIGGAHVLADYAILDARLTLSMPDSVIAATGMDALAHAIESYTAKCANDITRMYSKESFKLIYNNLPKVFENREDLVARRKVLLGSCLAGTAIFNSNTGAAHSLSYALGVYQNIPHGLAVARLLAEVIRVNVSKGCTQYADLYQLIDGRAMVGANKNGAQRFVEELSAYVPLKYLGLEFKDFGINENNYEFLAERGLDLIQALSNNPVDFGLDDAKNVLKILIKERVS